MIFDIAKWELGFTLFLSHWCLLLIYKILFTELLMNHLNTMNTYAAVHNGQPGETLEFFTAIMS